MAERKEENKGQTDRLTWSTLLGWTKQASQSVSWRAAGFLGSWMGWQLAEASAFDGTSGLGEMCEPQGAIGRWPRLVSSVPQCIWCSSLGRETKGAIHLQGQVQSLLTTLCSH